MGAGRPVPTPAPGFPRGCGSRGPHTISGFKSDSLSGQKVRFNSIRIPPAPRPRWTGDPALKKLELQERRDHPERPPAGRHGRAHGPKGWGGARPGPRIRTVEGGVYEGPWGGESAHLPAQPAKGAILQAHHSHRGRLPLSAPTLSMQTPCLLGGGGRRSTRVRRGCFSGLGDHGACSGGPSGRACLSRPVLQLECLVPGEGKPRRLFPTLTPLEGSTRKPGQCRSASTEWQQCHKGALAWAGSLTVYQSGLLRDKLLQISKSNSPHLPPGLRAGCCISHPGPHLGHAFLMVENRNQRWLTPPWLRRGMVEPASKGRGLVFSHG